MQDQARVLDPPVSRPRARTPPSPSQAPSSHVVLLHHCPPPRLVYFNHAAGTPSTPTAPRSLPFASALPQPLRAPRLALLIHSSRPLLFRLIPNRNLTLRLSMTNSVDSPPHSPPAAAGAPPCPTRSLPKPPAPTRCRAFVLAPGERFTLEPCPRPPEAPARPCPSCAASGEELERRDSACSYGGYCRVHWCGGCKKMAQLVAAALEERRRLRSQSPVSA